MAVSNIGVEGESVGCRAGERGLSYYTNINGALECEQVFDAYYQHQGLVASHGIGSPSVAFNEVGDVYISYLFAYYPDPFFRAFWTYYVYEANKVDDTWSRSLLEPNGFENPGSSFDLERRLNFNRTRLDQNGSPITTFFDGEPGVLQINRIIGEEDLELPTLQNIILIKALKDNLGRANLD